MPEELRSIATETAEEAPVSHESLQDAAPVPPFPVIGVGASAGGLEAFGSLLEHLPGQTGLALLFVQHLDPSHKSLLADILSRKTTLVVREASDGMAVESNHVFIIPPDARMTVEQGTIRVQPRGDRTAPNLPVDHLFRSLASEFGSRAVAVVLSGGGTDGTLGVQSIKAAGGITFAQDERSARQIGMPASAVASGCVDSVLPPEGIARELVRLTSHPYLAASGASAESEPEERDQIRVDELAPLLNLLRNVAGLDFSQYKRSTLGRRVDRRMALRGFETHADLLRAVREDPVEREALIRDLLIGVTSFFRDPAIFEALQQTAFPALIRDRSPEAGIRIWVPGCSTGEEAYSIVISLLESFGESNADLPIKVLATDVNETSLAKARAGTYPENIASDVSPERLRRFFRKVDGQYTISKAVRDMCVFAVHDVARDPPFARMDLISCRNVLIYFDATLQRRILPLFHYALRPNGFLVLGPSESIGTFTDLFAPADRENQLFTRTLAASRFPLPGGGGSGAHAREFGGRLPTEMPADGAGLAEVQREAERILSRFAPAGVLVDDHLTVLQFRGDTSPYLRHPQGTASLDLLRMAREGLLSDLSEGIEAARAGNAPIRRTSIAVINDGLLRSVDLQIFPLSVGLGGMRCFLILFEETSSGIRAAAPSRPSSAEISNGTAPTGEAANELISHIRQELEASRDHLQAVIEEYEATNEELKSANEEILASNEELQSTNEELLTAKEEMQSTNEALNTVNDELQHRNKEVGLINDDLTNLLAGVQLPVVMVGRDLRIRRVTVAAKNTLNLLPSDVGRPLRNIRSDLDLSDLESSITRVIDTLDAAAFETQDEAGRWFSVRIRPYVTHENRIDGAVITVIDIDALKRGAQELRDSRDFVTAVLDSVQTSLVVLDGEFQIHTANRSFLRTFRFPAEGEQSRSIFTCCAGAWDVPPVHELLERVRADGLAVDDFELVQSFPEIGKRTLRLNVRPVASAEPVGSRLLVAIEDVTDRCLAESARHDLEVRMFQAQKLESIGVLAGGVAHDLNNILTPILSYADLVKDMLPADSPAQPLLKEVVHSTGRAADLVQQILSYAGMGRFFVSTVDLSQLVQGISGLLEAMIPKTVEIRYELAPEILPVHVDAAQIQQVVMNLVTNAAESLPDGRGTVTIRTAAVTATRDQLSSPYLETELVDGPCILLEVSDTGCGMNEEMLSKIFDPFFTTKFLGRGLGLAAVIGIVRGHRGSLSVQSIPGRGSSFRIYLPRSERAVEESPPPAAEASEWRGVGTILVVDDEESIRRMVSALLRLLGLTVLEADDGLHGIEVFGANREQIALVLLDLTMPRMGGLEALEILQKERPDLPVILMSGYGLAEITRISEGRVVAGFLQKPFHRSELCGAIQRALAAVNPVTK